MTTVAVLGAGNMAGAIARALAGADAPITLRLTTGSSRPEWCADLAHVSHEAVAEQPEANARAVRGADAVILGVKPQGIAPLAAEIGSALEDGALVVSVAGGITLATLADALPDRVVAVRTMPNTPVAVGRGLTAFAVAPGAPEGTADAVRALLAPTGEVLEMDEGLIDGFSAVAGSGPAYVYYVIEALRAAAVDQGLDTELAARMVPEMIGGAVAYLQSTGREPDDLRAEVTSPGGSTAAAVAAFDRAGIPQGLRDGVAAAVARAQAMGRGE